MEMYVMEPTSRVVLACVTAFIAWTVIQSLRSGTIVTRGITIEASQQPRRFSFSVVAHIAVGVLFGWIAAGGDYGALMHAVTPSWLAINRP
jgi:4-hydroxybenzoate polyprenyltransferase